ncbi:flagellar biosynthetic protein FliR [Mixta calida]|uniref:Flagellar biosynthetic protein FliR n=2 Tax=Mixta calida TaxID=665913 RepID=A0ABM6RW23_9GAMM|nr:flagellar biosynthetic protein FliR [Mixta calida]AUY23575.1 flagellar type III secretion system protein FliR [Mixta calida]KAF0857826.1 flagellar biosynthesis protein FliR [Mixta calida B021323]ORM52298.1 flagellar biosynthetic protein FliR [Mixta calida]
MTWSLDALPLLVSHYFWPLMRVLALIGTAPVFNDKAIGNRVKVGLAAAITLLIGQNLPENTVPMISVMGLWVGCQQMLIGAAMGLTIQLIFVTVRYAGEIIGLQMGLSFATFYDPSGGENMPVVSRILNLLGILLFLLFNGHLLMLNALAESFQLLPISAAPLSRDAFIALPQTAGLVFQCGVGLGLPVITLLLAINLTLGLLNRLTPQLSIFVVGFPLTLVVGMLALLLLMNHLAPYFYHLIALFFERLSQILLLFRTG